MCGFHTWKMPNGLDCNFNCFFFRFPILVFLSLLFVFYVCLSVSLSLCLSLSLSHSLSVFQLLSHSLYPRRSILQCIFLLVFPHQPKTEPTLFYYSVSCGELGPELWEQLSVSQRRLVRPRDGGVQLCTRLEGQHVPDHVWSAQVRNRVPQSYPTFNPRLWSEQLRIDLH